LLASNAFHAEIFVRKNPNGQGLKVGVRRRVMDIHVEPICILVVAGPLELRVVGSLKTFSFFVRDSSGKNHDLGSAPTRLFTTELVTGWTGTMIGLYATGQGRTSEAHADFDWFEYQPG